jgi:SH3-like domain-containing protein
LETLIAQKKVSQWRAITTPAARNLNIFCFVSLIVCFLNKKIIPNEITAITILYHTKGNASKEIKCPNIAVNPQIKTIK